MAAIYVYWKLPRHRKGCCHFKESCSRYVYRTTDEQGIMAGLTALKQRYAQCRPNIVIITIEGNDFILFQDNTIIERTKTNI